MQPAQPFVRQSGVHCSECFSFLSKKMRYHKNFDTHQSPSPHLTHVDAIAFILHNQGHRILSNCTWKFGLALRPLCLLCLKDKAKHKNVAKNKKISSHNNINNNKTKKLINLGVLINAKTIAASPSPPQMLPDCLRYSTDTEPDWSCEAALYSYILSIDWRSLNSHHFQEERILSVCACACACVCALAWGMNWRDCSTVHTTVAHFNWWETSLQHGYLRSPVG